MAMGAALAEARIGNRVAFAAALAEEILRIAG